MGNLQDVCGSVLAFRGLGLKVRGIILRAPITGILLEYGRLVELPPCFGNSNSGQVPRRY